MNAWLGEGGWVVASSDRAARAQEAEFHRARRAEGKKAWAAPRIVDWKRFVREAWQARAADGRMVLNGAQERALWAGILEESGEMPAVLEGPRHRLAAMAMEAHGLLCWYAPKLVQNARARIAWEGDAGTFSRWLTGFDARCEAEGLVSESRMALEVAERLKAEGKERPGLMLMGFDRIVPVQRSVLEAWGVWRQAGTGARAGVVQYHAAEDVQSELEACAAWCGRRLEETPEARLLVVTGNTVERWGALERAFQRRVGEEAFEFSLGVPLGKVGLARGARLTLRWLSGAIAEHEVDWLLGRGLTAANDEETLALLGAMRAIRRNELERPEWTLEAFQAQARGAHAVPAAWAERMRRARGRLTENARARGPVEWAGVVPQVLEEAGWPGGQGLKSVEFQALRRWEQAVDETASLGFDGRRVEWKEFLAALERNVEETLFAPESREAPIQIAGPAESAGLTADGVWFLGASEEGWPARGATHPLLPLDAQRDAGMPHATAQLDWELARTMTMRLLESTAEAHFSFARQDEKGEARASRLVEQEAGKARQLARAEAAREPVTVAFEDFSRVPFPPGKAGGGAGVLTSQSQCPFKAFATARLGALGWEAAEQGLTAKQRGQLLHEVLHSVWGEPPHGIRTHAALQEKLRDIRSFVAGHVARVLVNKLPEGARARMPRKYLDLEGQRLTELVSRWLEYEAARRPFSVVDTEVNSDVAIGGLALKLRLDRVDRLNDGSLLVIDYKTGNVSPTVWELPRPDDVQLPLYAGFALDRAKEAVGGLVFAKVRPGELAFAGRVGDAQATLLPDLGPGTNLVKVPLTAEELKDWRDCIEQLARDFVEGRAEVAPRDYPKTCERCGLQTLCRIQEHRTLIEDEDGAAGEEAADE